MNSRSDQCENRVSEVSVVGDRLKSDILKTIREREKWIQQLLDDTKTNLRSVGINEKSDDSTNGIKKLVYQIIAGNFPNKEKEFNMQLSETYRTSNSPNHKRSSP